MLPKQNKYLITSSLISSWQYGLTLEGAYDEFLQTLEGKKTKPNKRVLDGRQFENILNAVLNGAEIDDSHEWYKPIQELYPILVGAQQQVALSKDVTIQGIPLVLYGRLDYLKAGIVYDTKLSKSYCVGKYLDACQHAMYLELCSEAREFQYKICDGKWVYTETYTPDETTPIEVTIKHFLNFLEKQNLLETYFQNWKSKF